MRGIGLQNARSGKFDDKSVARNLHDAQPLPLCAVSILKVVGRGELILGNPSHRMIAIEDREHGATCDIGKHRPNSGKIVITTWGQPGDFPGGGAGGVDGGAAEVIALHPCIGPVETVLVEARIAIIDDFTKRLDGVGDDIGRAADGNRRGDGDV